MKRLYSIFIFLAEKLLPFFVWADPKLNLFVQGRKNVFAELKTAFQKTDQIFWFHAASLGEYEQAVPVMKAVKNAFPDHKILVTFFSPSGYEVRKNNKLADLTVYLPLDTKKNAKNFVERVRPSIAFFIKYEVWPNYLQELENHGIKTLLIS
ncbi:MAG TPA: glycosyltransferase N-terminal domain-containing protein, partial [Flavobacteriaceae bacterium]|nr:glycosyltransferase N-terminal domain-containing protein [Flavobacteriaceae bacterium]